MKMSDYYQTLGVPKGASQEEIKKAYRTLAMKHHPDRGGDANKFKEIEEAYRILSDPQKKNQYDNPNPFAGGGFNFGQHNFDINDFFNQAFGGQHRRQHTAQYRTTIWVTLEQAYTGAEHQVQLGNGREIYKLRIPQGVADGQVIRYDNLIPNAILLVDYRIHHHAYFRRKNNDLYCTEKVNVLALIMGTTIQVKTIAGSTLDVTIKPSTQPGTTMRIPAWGMKDGQNNGHVGDQYVLIETFIPDTISDTLLTAIKQEPK